MNLLNTIKKSKHITLAVVFSLGAVFSASAAPIVVDQTEVSVTSNIQSTISTFLVAQGNEIISDISVNLENSISTSIDQFSIDLMIDQSLAWLTSDEVAETKTKTKNDESVKTSDCANEE